MHTLIVDDIADNLYMLRVLLEGHGHTVDSATDGVQALEMARLSPPDLVVSDLLMPVMDGYTLLRHWKADGALRLIPFVVYTATYTDPKDERLALALGADAFIIKPAEPEALMACIDTVLAQGARVDVPPAAENQQDDERLLADYNQTLVRKLEKRAQQLEATNLELQAAMEESRRVQAALHDSEQRFRATFEQAAVGIAHVAPDNRFLRVNDKLCEITGQPREALLRMALPDLSQPDDRGDIVQAHQAMLAGTQASHTSETRYQRPSGGLFWGSLVSTLLRDEHRQPQYFIVVIADISERKALEEQFRQSQKIESIGQLSGGIAHDFNNLLTIIIGNTELLAERLADDDTLRPLAEMVRSAAQRGADLTRRLLAFARRQSLEPRAVDVNALLLGMQALLQRMLPEHIDVRLVPGQRLWPALVDTSQLESAILNLAINARDAMPGGGCLTLATANVVIDAPDRAAGSDAVVEAVVAAGGDAPGAAPGPGAYVRLTVSDTGTGIAPEHLAHVFEPFFTTKPVGQGTGLGLSMVHGFIKQSRGHMTLRSEPGRGTTLELFLPRTRRQSDLAVVEAPALADLRGSESILLVEDDELVRRLAERQLAAIGYRVSSVGDAAAALAALRASDDIDLLMTDIVMPGTLSGPQLAEEALRLRPGLKLLFCSGYSDDAFQWSDAKDRRAPLLNKPYGRLELARKVRAVLAQPSPTPSPPGAVAQTGPPGTLLILDDDPTVAMVLGRAAETLGFRARLASTPQALFESVVQLAPSHVSLDLHMPEMNGLQILRQLAQGGCASRIIISSGADRTEIETALAHGREIGLTMAGMLPKPFALPELAALLKH
jgi:PAS domain S-box-containing protein